MNHGTADRIPLRVLCVQQSPGDAENIGTLLAAAGYDVRLSCAGDNSEFDSLLRAGAFDVILCDFTFPGFDAIAALELSARLRPNTPYICVAGRIGEENAICLVKRGALDFVSRDRIAALPAVIRRGLEEAKARLLQLEETVTLRESEERYRSLVTFSPDALYVHVDTRVVLVNPALCQLLGAVDPAELVGRSVFDIVHPDYHMIVRNRWTRVFEGQPAPLCEEQFLRLDGSVVDVEVNAVAIDWQGSRGVQVVARDITERRQVRGALIASELRYRRLFEAAKDGILILDAETGTIVDVNPFLQNLLGYARGQLIGIKVWELGFLKDIIANRESFLELKEKGYIRYDDTPLETADGRSLAVEFVSNMYETNHHRVIQCNIRDITERKAAEELIRDSEERFRMVFEHVFDGISIYSEDPDPSMRRLVECNERYAAMAGRSRRDLLELGNTTLLQETSRENATGIRTEALANGTAYTGSFSWNRPDGLANDIESVAVPITWRGRAYSIGIDRDITQRKRSERQIRLMAHTVASVQDCISITDLQNRFLLVNDAFRATYGYTTGELLGQDASLLRSPAASVADLARMLPDTLAGGWHGEVLHRRKDGTDLPVELWMSVVRDETGDPVALVGVGRNITERKLAEEHLMQSEEQFRLIAENVADMIAVLDLEGKWIYNSPSYEGILGDPGSLRGTDGFRDVHPHDRDAVAKQYRDIVRTGEGRRIEYRLMGKDGSTRSIDSKGSAIRDGNGNISRVVLVSRDVTEEKRLAAHFLRAQRMESIGTLAGGIAHDLNNVLSPILMAIELLRGRVSDPGGKKILNTMETSAQHGSDIVKQVLAFGRGVEGERILVQLKHVIKEVVAIAGQTFPKSMSIETDIPRDLWTVSADPTQMQQVLLNILVNARDAMPGGGTITVTAENAAIDAKYSLTHLEAKPGNYVSIAIADSGEGIPPDIRDKIFEPFFTTKEIGSGTGLGLSTTLAIVKSHEGFINLTSDVGRGTEFRIYIPAKGTATDFAAASHDAELPAGNGELILVIDDESAIREITTETLRTYGYRVLSASDGAEGVEVYARHGKSVSVVITDIMMPVMDGTAAILALRKINPRVKIIAVSGLTSGGHPDPPADSDEYTFLTKPFTAETLLRALAAVLR
jgi:PAS domain S-box-containing protein